MQSYVEISSPEIYFVADSHFRIPKSPEETDRRAIFFRFLETIPSDSALLLLGDIFDFYFEYATVVSNRYFDVFHALHNCYKRGVELHFLGGNHDYWIGDFLKDEVGIRVHPDDFLIHSQGRNIRCTHGDLLMPNDRGYRTIRAILRNPFLIGLARLLHPDLLAVIGNRVSKESRKKKRHTPEEMASQLADIAGERFFEWDNDVFVMGHIHYPLHRSHDGRDFVILGDWIENFTYGRLRKGKMSLEKFKS